MALYKSCSLERADSKILNEHKHTQSNIAMTESIYFKRMLLTDIVQKLRNLVNLDRHMIIDLNHHSDRLRILIVYLLQLVQEIRRFLLIEGRVYYQEGNYRPLPPKS